MTSINNKIAFILGAGFSLPAGAPSQAGLLRRIFELPPESGIGAAQQKLRDFLVQTLHFDQAHLNNISLEDVFTPIDRCLADGLSLRNLNQQSLHDIRETLEYLISMAIDRSIIQYGDSDKRYVDAFADHVVRRASERAKKAEGKIFADEAKDYDPVAIVSLNWDIVLDRAIHHRLASYDEPTKGDYAPMGVVDYCCYVSSLDDSDRRIGPGLWALGARGFNVKLLKIHGSMNWLQCSNCQRLYVSFGQKLVIPNYQERQHCRHCQKHDIVADLQVSLVMPTFLKDLTNFQIKLVWQNAGVELMEAREVVFIGYSLPHADFEFRQLLARMIHPSAKIRVELYEEAPTFKDECERYKQFFSGRDVTISGRGVAEYVRALCEHRNEESEP